jgi:hypothetical protein
MKKERILGIIGDKHGEEYRRLFVYKNVHGYDGDVEIVSEKSRYYGDLVGCFVVKYEEPSIFPMSIEEVHGEEFSQAWNILEENGHIERNDHGVPFWKD